MTNEEAKEILEWELNSFKYTDNEFVEATKVAIKALEERPKGKWIYDGIYHDNDNPIDNDMYRCSLCKRSIITALTNPTELFPYCHCGADMRGE